jgi:hypothetical protein
VLTNKGTSFFHCNRKAYFSDGHCCTLETHKHGSMSGRWVDHELTLTKLTPRKRAAKYRTSCTEAARTCSVMVVQRQGRFESRLTGSESSRSAMGGYHVMLMIAFDCFWKFDQIRSFGSLGAAIAFIVGSQSSSSMAPAIVIHNLSADTISVSRKSRNCGKPLATLNQNSMTVVNLPRHQVWELTLGVSHGADIVEKKHPESEGDSSKSVTVRARPAQSGPSWSRVKLPESSQWCIYKFRVSRLRPGLIRQQVSTVPHFPPLP